MDRGGLLFGDTGGEVRDAGGQGQGVLRGLLVVLLVFLGTRLVVWAATYQGALVQLRIACGLEPPMVVRIHSFLKMCKAAPDEAEPIRDAERDFLGHFAPLLQWDGQHYLDIATNGYQYSPGAPLSNPGMNGRTIAFFPLYPLICSQLVPLLGAPAALVLVSNGSALLAAVLLYLWLRRRIDETGARLAVACLLCWPTACFYAYGYSEATTLLTIVAALMLMDRGRFGAASVASGLATAARPTALPLAAVFALSYWLRSRLPARRRAARLAVLGLVAVGGLLAYAGFLTWRYGTPLVYVQNFKDGWIPEEARSGWFQYLTLARVWDQFKYIGRTFRGFPASLFPGGLLNLGNPQMWNMPCNFAILLLSLIGMRRVPPSFRPYLWLGPLIFLQAYLASGGASFGVEPIARYTAVAVPAFVVLAAWMRHWPAGGQAALLTALMLIQTAWAFAFGAFEWAG